MPAMSVLAVALPPLASDAGGAGAGSGQQAAELVTIEGIVDQIEVMASLMKPKKVRAEERACKERVCEPCGGRAACQRQPTRLALMPGCARAWRCARPHPRPPDRRARACCPAGQWQRALQTIRRWSALSLPPAPTHPPPWRRSRCWAAMAGGTRSWLSRKTTCARTTE